MTLTSPLKQTWLSGSETGRLMQYQATPVIRATLLSWTVILATLYICAQRPSAWMWGFGLVLIGIEQNALSVLLHEAAHGFIHPNRLVNDGIAASLYGAPILLQLGVYRDRHWQHHRALGTVDDTKRYPRSSIRGYRFLRHVFLSLTGVLAVRMAWTYARRLRTDREAHRVVNLVLVVFVQAGVLAVCWAMGNLWMYPILWILPIFTVMTLLVSIRSMAEHQPRDLPENLSDDEDISEISRTVHGNIVSRLIFAQFNFNYHHEHHLFPQIPFWNLPELHRLLKSKGYYDAHPEWLVSGYSNVFRALVDRTPDFENMASPT